MSTSSNSCSLYNSETQERLNDVIVDGLDVIFPDFVHGWSDVLDCRIPPYTGLTVEENCNFAIGVRKYYILVENTSE